MDFVTLQKLNPNLIQTKIAFMNPIIVEETGSCLDGEDYQT